MFSLVKTRPHTQYWKILSEYHNFPNKGFIIFHLLQLKTNMLFLLRIENFIFDSQTLFLGFRGNRRSTTKISKKSSSDTFQGLWYPTLAQMHPSGCLKDKSHVRIQEGKCHRTDRWASLAWTSLMELLDNLHTSCQWHRCVSRTWKRPRKVLKRR